MKKKSHNDHRQTSLQRETVETLKKRVVAWSKLASSGARPVGEKAGISRETFARVLNERRRLTNDETEALAAVLGLGPEGFQGHRIEANLCRFLSDIDALPGVEISIDVIAHLRSTKEIRGGAPLQRYCIALATAGKTQRLMVLRMATKKFDEWLQAIKQPELPVVEFDTVVLPLMSEIQYEIEDKEWAEFLEILSYAHRALLPGYDRNEDDERDQRTRAVAGLGKWLGRTLVKVLQKTEAGQINPNIARRVRSSDVLKLAKEDSVLALWPTGAREYAKQRALVPLTTEFQPFHAAGVLKSGNPVFVYMSVYSEERGLYIPEAIRELGGYVLVFKGNEKASTKDKNVLFEGDASALCEWMKYVHFEGLHSEEEQVHGLMQLSEEISDSMKLREREIAG